MRKIEVGPNDDNQRLDRFLQKYLEQAPKSLLQKYVRTKKIKVNGKRAQADQMIFAGDTIDIYIYEEELVKYERIRRAKKGKLELTVAYEDENILIVDKPKGVLSHAASPEDYGNNVVDWFVDYLIAKKEFVPRLEKTFRPAIVNRLDFNTEGLILCAKNHQTLLTMNQIIQQREGIHKYYLAVVNGNYAVPKTYTGAIQRVKEGVFAVGDDDGSKGAETRVKPLEQVGGNTVVEVELVTGRTHQIRVHLSEDGFPIVGDPKYGNRSNRHQHKARSQMLIAYKLVFDKDAFEKIDAYSYLAGKEVLSSQTQAFFETARAK